MNSKIFVCDAASLEESEILGLRISDSITLSTYIVNPLINSIVNKTIVIDLPLNINYDRLKRFNRIVSRFPIECDKYQLNEFKLPDKVEEVKDESEISCLILNKHLLSDINYVNQVKGKKFLLGVEPLTSEALNLVGYILLKSKFSNINNSSDGALN